GAGLALAAVQIFPTVELLRHSLRSEASYDFFSSFSMPRRFVLTFLAPYLMGGGDGRFFRAPYVGPSFYAEYVGYVGLATLALAFVACVFKRDVRTVFWAAVIPLGILLALGRYAPLGFYKFVYAVPVLNLFRVPARHLMEVQFALAILAGRGLTALELAPDRKRILRWVAIGGAVLFIATCLTVSLGRPPVFRLGRDAPVTILRAPELFLPPFLALLSMGAIWLATVRRGTATTLLLLATVYLDLNLWGQFSGWRASSPTATSELWQEPAAFRFVRERHDTGPQAPYRIFTQDHFFDPNQPVSYAAPVEAWLVALQPDIAMMWGLDNAAGYEGFGLARYSQLAGDMKVWGDLTDPDRTLRGESRELDLLNIRYFFARSSSAPTKKPAPPTEQTITAREVYGGQKFVKELFDLPGMTAGERLAFDVSPTETNRFALTSVLAWSAAAPDDVIVAHLKLWTNDGKSFEFAIRAGEHTSEWAYDRADICAQIRHRRAPVATSYVVAEANPNFEAHDYVASFELPAGALIVRGEITVAPVSDAPRLSLSIGRMSLINGERVLPIRKEWITLDSSRTQTPPAPVASSQLRWQHLADVGPVAIFENKRALPRAWLVPGERIASDEQQLQIIRTGKVSGTTKWDPLSEALVEKTTKVIFPQEQPQPGKVEVSRLEPNRVSITVESFAPALLVLADNYYPGWRADVDGHQSTIHRVNFNQRAVPVPAGKHVVDFVYAPRSVFFGLIISGFSLVLLLWWMNSQPRTSGQ
ncbi:MAG: YfhO family protein, partial [Chthoniobacterales bacterium]